jgi:signal transduction histidine kinase/putative methionine-R-sulfoxide reductase with GAF domain
MGIKNDVFVKQMAEACKISQARWAVCLNFSQGEWILTTQYGIRKSQEKALFAFLHNVKVTSWLSGAMGNCRVRSRDVGDWAARLGCQRLFAFPVSNSSNILIVGFDRLEKSMEAIWRILAMNFSCTPDYVPVSVSPAPFLEPGLEAPYDPADSLQNILDSLVGMIPCEAAYLAIRTGDFFTIQAVWNFPITKQGLDLSISEFDYLSRVVTTRNGVIIKPPMPGDVSADAPNTLWSAYRSWMLIPILIGQRVIGHFGFASSQAGFFSHAELKTGSTQVTRVAYRVENAIVFAEAARFLQQFALLNELASAASLGVDTNEVASRVIERLSRTFNTDRVAVLILSQDGKSLRGFGGREQDVSLVIPVDTSLVGYVVETGLPARVGDVRLVSRYRVSDPTMQSELAVPLRYRSQIIGALALESTELNAFTVQDEQLLIVIASQLAGLIENVRLNDETRERAQKLAYSVRQLQAVRETALDITSDLSLDPLLQRVVHRVRELVDARGAELGLYDEKDQVVRIQISETPWESTLGEPIPLMAGVAGRVVAFGEPLIVSDYNQWNGRLRPETPAPFRTVAGVPLKFRIPGSEKPSIIGALTVQDDRPEKQFSQADIDLLELLAPQVAVSIRNARLYQELQEVIEAQRLAENRLIRSARLAAVGEMAASVAHELNNPLTTVIGFVELILHDIPPDAPQVEDLRLVLKEAQRTRGVVRRLLDFSRPSENIHERTEMNDLIVDTLALVQHQARAANIEVVLELDHSLPMITIDPNQIKQVLLNLFHNAILAMPSGGSITLKTKRETRGNQNWLRVLVCDTGEGIAAENMDRIFEPFFTTRPPGLGTGLGLSVSYGIVSDHGGSIEVESHPGLGSNFSIFLPIDQETHA